MTVFALAGTGKTTTLEYLTSLEPNTATLMFNRRLAQESRDRLGGKVSTLHAFVQEYYAIHCSNDTGLYRVLLENLAPIKPISFTIFVMDEAQDCTQLMVDVLNKILTDNEEPSQLILLGDSLQSIYGYNGADPKFMLNPGKYFNVNGGPDNWETATLSTTWRCTRQVARLVNQVFGTEMKSEKEGVNPEYVTCNPDNVANMIIQYMNKRGLTPGDVCIMSSFLRNNYDLTKIANSLSRYGVPLYLSMISEDLDSKMTKNHMLISSIHQMKGGQRKCTFIYNFDASYHRIFHQEGKNLFYVAMTRATDYLVMIQGHKEYPLQFLPPLAGYVDFYGYPMDNRPRAISSKAVKKPRSVTQILASMDSLSCWKLWQHVKTTEIRPCGDSLSIPRAFHNKRGGLEDLSGIIGNLIPMLIAHSWNGSTHPVMETTVPESFKPYLDLKYPGIQGMAHLANVITCINSGYIYPLEQVRDYNWITQYHIDQILDRVEFLSPEEAIWELPVSDPDNLCIGSVDLAYPDSFWELKVTSDLTLSHIHQLAAYIALYYVSYGKLQKGYLYNIYTDQLILVEFRTGEEAENFAQILVNLQGGAARKMITGSPSCETSLSLAVCKNVIATQISSQETHTSENLCLGQEEKNREDCQAGKLICFPTQKLEEQIRYQDNQSCSHQNLQEEPKCCYTETVS